MSIYIAFCPFTLIYHVDLCRALSMSVEVADMGGTYLIIHVARAKNRRVEYAHLAKFVI